MLTIYNSLTKRKEAFQPIEPGHVRMYVCGVTVYDYCHLGNARPWVVFDMVARYLRARGYKVTYIRNITDIDDKIIERANQNKESYEAITKRFTLAMHEDETALEVNRPDQEPKATEFISPIIKIIEKLIEKQFAYVGKEGDVYYAVRAFKEYGKLSHRSLDDLDAGARVEINPNKKDPLDFTLWKLAKPGEPQWDSPWGPGRPGWHIECSAMSSALLGQPFDIHGGGLDLKFPHHENEIAQSEAAENQPFVKIWMHSGMLEINNEKMSKSLGNIIKVRDALKENDSEVLRYFLLSAHYRSPLNYSKENMANARSSLERFYIAIRGLILKTVSPTAWTEKFYAAMDDDFNLPQALAVLFEMASEINRHREKDLPKAIAIASELKQLAEILGILSQDPETFLKGKITNTAEIESLIQQRNEARANKDWATADRIRDQLKSQGIIIEDASKGTGWRKE